jgi:hypothetical protein
LGDFANCFWAWDVVGAARFANMKRMRQG